MIICSFAHPTTHVNELIISLNTKVYQLRCSLVLFHVEFVLSHKIGQIRIREVCLPVFADPITVFQKDLFIYCIIVLMATFCVCYRRQESWSCQC